MKQVALVVAGHVCACYWAGCVFGAVSAFAVLWGGEKVKIYVAEGEASDAPLSTTSTLHHDKFTNTENHCQDASEKKVQGLLYLCQIGTTTSH